MAYVIEYIHVISIIKKSHQGFSCFRFFVFLPTKEMTYIVLSFEKTVTWGLCGRERGEKKKKKKKINSSPALDESRNLELRLRLISLIVLYYVRTVQIFSCHDFNCYR